MCSWSSQRNRIHMNGKKDTAPLIPWSNHQSSVWIVSSWVFQPISVLNWCLLTFPMNMHNNSYIFTSAYHIFAHIHSHYPISPSLPWITAYYSRVFQILSCHNSFLSLNSARRENMAFIIHQYHWYLTDNTKTILKARWNGDAFNASIQEADEGGSLRVRRQLDLHNEFQASLGYTFPLKEIIIKKKGHSENASV